MTARIARRPCGSCPYRRDVPSGLWDSEEYAKLPGYDTLTEQSLRAFSCHQQNGNLCAGWVACHGPKVDIALRVGFVQGTIDGPTLEAALNYSTDVPVFGSGQEAADHGMAEVEMPGPQAIREIHKLELRAQIRRSRGQD